MHCQKGERVHLRSRRELDSSGLYGRAELPKPHIGTASPRTRAYEKVLLAAPYGFLLFLTVSALLVLHIRESLPEAGQSDVNVCGFSEIHARHQLSRLSDFVGERAKSHYQKKNAILQWLHSQLLKYRSGSRKQNIRLEIKYQRFSGTFHFSRPIVARNVTNLLVRLSHERDTDLTKSVLINVPYDVTNRSPGVSASAVALAMELIRSHVRCELPLFKSLIVLFSDAHGHSMLGARAFFRHHRWASTVKYAINSGAIGAGGRQALARMDPGLDWLAAIYAQKATYPKASSAFYDVLSAGVLKLSFLDALNLTAVRGIDLYNLQNGYIVGTDRDVAKHVSNGSLQQAGHNTQCLLGALLAGAPQISDDLEHRPIFFDLFGITMAVFTFSDVRILLVIAALASIFLTIALFKLRLISVSRLKAALISSIAGLFGGAILSNLPAILVTFGFELPIRWFSSPTHALVLHVSWATLGMLLVQSLSGYLILGGEHVNALALAWGNLMFWEMVLLVCYYAKLGCIYVPMLWTTALLVFLACGMLIERSGSHSRTTRLLGMVCYVFFIPPTIICLQLLYDVIIVAVPMMSQMSNVPGDLIIAMIASVGAVCVFHAWLGPLLSRSKSLHQHVTWSVLIIAVIALLTSFLLTPYGEQTPKRMVVEHWTKEHVHVFNGLPIELKHRFAESGLLLASRDFIAPSPVPGGLRLDDKYAGLVAAPYLSGVQRLKQLHFEAPTVEGPWLGMQARFQRRGKFDGFVYFNISTPYAIVANIQFSKEVKRWQLDGRQMPGTQVRALLFESQGPLGRQSSWQLRLSVENVVDFLENSKLQVNLVFFPRNDSFIEGFRTEHIESFAFADAYQVVRVTASLYKMLRPYGTLPHVLNQTTALV